MLILARRKDEVIKIGNDVTVTVVRIEKGQVRLGIQAPKDIAVHRAEIYRRIAEADPVFDGGIQTEEAE